jgi:hypothetical protein
MRTLLLRLILLLLVLCLTAGVAAAQDKPAIESKAGKWVKMFDGKSLKGWEANENPGSWTVQNGALSGKGDKSHLFWKVKECGDCEFEAQAKLTHGSNSGMYFRTEWGPGFPKGYEAQVNNTHKDPKRTGSLYNFVDVREQLVPDDTWWTQRITVVGNHIVIQVNGKKVVDYVDGRNSFQKGFLALQQHDPKSVVEYRNLRMRELTPLKK